MRDGRFAEKQSGRPFHVSGFHYIRILPSGNHYVFSPSLYDAARVESMLADLEGAGFNTVRVFIGNHELIDGNALSGRFVANVCDFLERATRHHVYVVPVIDWIPGIDRYKRGTNDAFWRAGLQNYYLDPSCVRAKAAYLTDFIAAIKSRSPQLLSTIFAYELENEACIDITRFPFDAKKGTYAFGGKTYDLASSESVQALVDAAIVDYSNTMVRAIHGQDPEAMVSCSVFTFAAVGRTGPGKARSEVSADPRIPVRPLALTASDLSHIDLHFYSPTAAAFRRDMESVEWGDLQSACRRTGKPVIAGEFGAIRAFYPSLQEAASRMAWYERTFSRLGFQGSVYWTYDCDEQKDLWHSKSENGVIWNALVNARR